MRRSVITARVAVIRRIKFPLITAPEAVRTRWKGVHKRCLIETLATRPGPVTGSVTTANGHALRRLAR